MIAQWGSRSRVVSAGVVLLGVLVTGAGGTVKIDGVDIRSGPPDGTPHQGCSFVLEFSDFEEDAELSASVSFDDLPPTADGGVQVVSGDLSPFVGEDAAGGEGDLDAKETYTLKFTGEPEPELGYAVEIGVDGVSKPFWVQGCTHNPAAGYAARHSVGNPLAESVRDADRSADRPADAHTDAPASGDPIHHPAADSGGDQYWTFEQSRADHDGSARTRAFEACTETTGGRRGTRQGSLDGRPGRSGTGELVLRRHPADRGRSPSGRGGRTYSPARREARQSALIDQHAPGDQRSVDQRVGRRRAGGAERPGRPARARSTSAPVGRWMASPARP